MNYTIGNVKILCIHNNYIVKNYASILTNYHKYYLKLRDYTKT